MRTFDFNIHLPILTSDSVADKVGDESLLNVSGLLNALDYYKDDFKEISGMNLMLFNQSILDETASFDAVFKATNRPTLLTLLFDFHREDWKGYLDKAFQLGIKCIKFHSYVQKINEQSFSRIVEVSVEAGKKGMAICVDASYGSIDMYRYDNLKLTCAIAEKVKTTPIVILHSGGARTLEAMLIADECQNVYLETSFSLPYYEGSSIESDLAFVYKKLGSERIIYGSDQPYVSLEDSLKCHLKFFEKYKFTDYEIDNIMIANASRVFDL